MRVRVSVTLYFDADSPDDARNTITQIMDGGIGVTTASYQVGDVRRDSDGRLWNFKEAL